MHRERTSETRFFGLWSYCNPLTTMTMLDSGLLHPLHQPAMKSFVIPVTILSLSTYTCFECCRVIKKSILRAICTTCGQSCHLAWTYLPRRERESILYDCREWRCCAQHNHHQQAPCQAETITLPFKYPKAQLDKKSQLSIKKHKIGVPSKESRRIHSSINCLTRARQTRQEPHT